MRNPIDDFSKAFKQGYIFACAKMFERHGNIEEVEYHLFSGFISIDDLRRHGVDEYDIEVLMPVFNEIERKRALEGEFDWSNINTH